jgi:uncharacterized RDD family membrane protein YckC
MDAELTHSLRLRTAEGITFSQPLAGPLPRLLAWLVDVGIVFALTSALGIAVGLLGWVAPDVAVAASTLGFFLVQFGYAMLTEWSWRGQTVGKRILGLRVVDIAGHRLQFSQVAIRNLLRAVDILPGVYLVGGIAVLLSKHGQRLGDLAANTAVIRVPKLAQPDTSQLLAGKFNSLRRHVHLCGQLRQAVTPAEAALALSALQRRDDFEATARVALFRELAEHFREKVTFPAEATDGVADEQLVRNVVDVLYRTRAAEAA